MRNQAKALALGMVLYSLSVSDLLVPFSSSPQQTAAMSGRLRRPASRQTGTPRLSGRYPYYPQVETYISDAVDGLAACFLEDPSWNTKHIRLDLLWDGGGKFRRLKSEPAVNPEIESCLFRLVKRWQLQPHPGLQPFSHCFDLDLGGV